MTLDALGNRFIRFFYIKCMKKEIITISDLQLGRFFYELLEEELYEQKIDVSF